MEGGGSSGTASSMDNGNMGVCVCEGGGAQKEWGVTVKMQLQENKTRLDTGESGDMHRTNITSYSYHNNMLLYEAALVVPVKTLSTDSETHACVMKHAHPPCH